MSALPTEIDFDLSALIRAEINQSPSVDPGVIATAVLEQIPDAELRDVMWRLLRTEVRICLGQQRRSPRPLALVDDIDEDADDVFTSSAGEGKAPAVGRSWKVQAIGHAYRAVRSGELPAIRLGRRMLVKTAALRRMIDNESDAA
jgi:hypothetical protein